MSTWHFTKGEFKQSQMMDFVSLVHSRHVSKLITKWIYHADNEILDLKALIWTSATVLKFHTGGDFLKDANEILKTGKYWKEVVDVTAQVSAAALKSNVHIYQSNQGLIQVLSHKYASEGKDVYIKYRRFGTACYFNAIIKDTSIPISFNIPYAQERGEEREPNYEKEEEEEDEEFINILLARKTFPEFYLHSRRPLWVTEIPKDINGTRHYKMKSLWKCGTSNNKTGDISKMWQVKRNISLVQEFGTCMGSWICTNDDFSYYKLPTSAMSYSGKHMVTKCPAKCVACWEKIYFVV